MSGSSQKAGSSSDGEANEQRAISRIDTSDASEKRRSGMNQQTHIVICCYKRY